MQFNRLVRKRGRRLACSEERETLAKSIWNVKSTDPGRAGFISLSIIERVLTSLVQLFRNGVAAFTLARLMRSELEPRISASELLRGVARIFWLLLVNASGIIRS